MAEIEIKEDEYDWLADSLNALFLEDNPRPEEDNKVIRSLRKKLNKWLEQPKLKERGPIKSKDSKKDVVIRSEPYTINNVIARKSHTAGGQYFELSSSPSSEFPENLKSLQQSLEEEGLWEVKKALQDLYSNSKKLLDEVHSKEFLEFLEELLHSSDAEHVLQRRQSHDSAYLSSSPLSNYSVSSAEPEYNIPPRREKDSLRQSLDKRVSIEKFVDYKLCNVFEEKDGRSLLHVILLDGESNPYLREEFYAATEEMLRQSKTKLAEVIWQSPTIEDLLKESYEDLMPYFDEIKELLLPDD